MNLHYYKATYVGIMILHYVKFALSLYSYSIAPDYFACANHCMVVHYIVVVVVTL